MVRSRNMDYLAQYQNWLNAPYIDEASKEELRALAGQDKEIEDRFYRDLEFGTGGLRGKMGVGTNRMNVYIVRKATQGLANYLLQTYPHEKVQVAIAFDSRNHSAEFAQAAALCLAANGIHAWIYPSLRPTPMLSFAVRYKHCQAGIVLTASHNPAIYNGYKVYGADGAQITFPMDRDIIACVNQVTDFATIKTMSLENAQNAGLYHILDQEVDQAYFAAVESQIVNKENLKAASEVKIVYTPLHGTGNMPVCTVLKDTGFTQVHLVNEQATPDGNFPTVRSPNPEDAKALELALQLAKQVDADIVLGTDPDADRIGMYAKNAQGEYVPFTGNESGMLILKYICSQKQALGTLPADGAVVSTIVSGKMADKICADYNLTLIRCLTGFKYIGEQIKFFEQNHQHHFVFGYEESYGALIGTHARDKDAVVSALLLCEVAAFCKSQHKTVCDMMDEIYQQYGYFKEALKTLTLEGKDGAEQISKMMEKIRAHVPSEVASLKVLEFQDFQQDRKLNCVTQECSTTGLPRSNVLYFKLEHDAWFCIRPSGTEPKIKLYMGVSGHNPYESREALSALSLELEKLLSV